MSIFANPIFICGLIAFGIIAILVTVVVIFCKKSDYDEREDLKAISEDIDNGVFENIETDEDKIEDVLTKMQEALDVKEASAVSFEEEQEENAIISYQELLDSLGAKSSIDVSSIQVFDDELENQVEISDANKEIIEAYDKENLDKEIYMFQNDYSNQAMPLEVPSEENAFMNFDFSNENIEFVDEDIVSEKVNNVSFEENTVQFSDVTPKFKRTEVISPVYGIVDEGKVVDDVEEIIFDDSDSLLDEF